MKCLLKLSKKFLLLILMIVFPINSFAAVSVSDGSAFVSKSEFSATINNISNRMSIMENTLDAKIDSLVSSYLSRNGIWNGEKQTLINNVINFPTPTWDSTLTIHSGSKNIVNMVTNSSNYDIFTSTKSGMLTLNISYRAETSNATQRYWGYTSLTSNLNYKHIFDDNISIYMNVYEKSTNTLMASYLFGSSSGVLQTPPTMDGSNIHTNAQMYMVIVPFPGSSMYNSMIFFVEKNKTYYGKIQAQASIGYLTSLTGYQRITGTCRVRFRDSYVY